MKNFAIVALFTLFFALGCGGEGSTSGPSDSAQVLDAPTDGGVTTDTGIASDVSSSDLANVNPDTASPTDASSTPQPTDTAQGRKQPLPSGLKGVAPTGSTGLPQFSAVVDQDGQSVGPDRLVGTWSVLWFYPIASTMG